MKILISGPQGSGKTTQAKILAQKYGLLFISSGDLARNKAEEDNIDGRLVKLALSEGKLINDELMAKLMQEKIINSGNKNGFVFDGFPRDLNQLKYFDPSFDIVFYLDISDDEVRERLISRGREDDVPKIIGERLKLYHKLTEPVLSYYQSLGKLIKVDGSKSIEEISLRLSEEVNKRGDRAR